MISHKSKARTTLSTIDETMDELGRILKLRELGAALSSHDDMVWQTLKQAKNEILERISKLDDTAGATTAPSTMGSSRPSNVAGTRYPGTAFSIKVESMGPRPKELYTAVRCKSVKLKRSREPPEVKVSYGKAPFSSTTRRFSTTGLHPDIAVESIHRAIKLKSGNTMHSEKPIYEGSMSKEKHPSVIANNQWKEENHYRNTQLTILQEQEKSDVKKRAALVGPQTYDVNYKNKDCQFKGKWNRVHTARRGKIHRAKYKKLNVIPGPGTHLSHGSAVKEKSYLFEGPPFMEWTSGHGTELNVGSGICPNRYKIPGSLDLHHQNELKELYHTDARRIPKQKIFGSSNQQPGVPILATDAETYKYPKLGPGRYNPRSTCDIKCYHDEVKLTRYERLVKSYVLGKQIAEKEIKTGMIGPGSYNVRSQSLEAAQEDRRIAASKIDTSDSFITQAAWMKAMQYTDVFGFGCSSKRVDKATLVKRGCNSQTPGPAMYRPKDVTTGQKLTSGHTNVFNTKLHCPNALSPPYSDKTLNRARLIAQYKRRQNIINQFSNSTRKTMSSHVEMKQKPEIQAESSLDAPSPSKVEVETKSLEYVDEAGIVKSMRKLTFSMI